MSEDKQNRQDHSDEGSPTTTHLTPHIDALFKRITARALQGHGVSTLSLCWVYSAGILIIWLNILEGEEFIYWIILTTLAFTILIIPVAVLLARARYAITKLNWEIAEIRSKYRTRNKAEAATPQPELPHSELEAYVPDEFVVSVYVKDRSKARLEELERATELFVVSLGYETETRRIGRIP